MKPMKNVAVVTTIFHSLVPLVISTKISINVKGYIYAFSSLERLLHKAFSSFKALWLTESCLTWATLGEV